MRELILGVVEATRVRLAAVRASSPGDFELVAEEQFPLGEIGEFEAKFAAVRAAVPATEAALGVAGPIDGDVAQVTHQSFVVSARQLRRAHGLERVTICNDFVAVARGAVETPPELFRVLASGEGEANSALVVVGPGVGLGMGTIRKVGGRWFTLDSEGGHQAYAPCDADEIRLVQELSLNGHYVTFEDVISERGVVEVYRTFCRLLGGPTNLDTLDAIAEAGRARATRAAVLTCEVAARSIATFAGNACLSHAARGGVLLAGSVARALEPFLATEEFVQRFRRRGSMTLYIAQVPVRLIQDDHVAYRGLIANALTEPAP